MTGAEAFTTGFRVVINTQLEGLHQAMLPRQSYNFLDDANVLSIKASPDHPVEINMVG